MVFLQPKLSLKVTQRQILTPGLMQMVSVLALNKLELKEMINTEIVENPVLEELDEKVPLLDELAGREAERDRSLLENETARKEADPFDEIDFGSYFQEYLDPGFRTPHSFEVSEKPSFEQFLSQPSTLTDHLCWQLGSLNVSLQLRRAAEYVIGNLDEDGYLPASDDELLEGFLGEQAAHPAAAQPDRSLNGRGNGVAHGADAVPNGQATGHAEGEAARATLCEAIRLVQNLDPVGVATRNLRECLQVQLNAQLKLQLDAQLKARLKGAQIKAVQPKPGPFKARRAEPGVLPLEAREPSLRDSGLAPSDPRPPVNPDLSPSDSQDGAHLPLLPVSVLAAELPEQTGSDETEPDGDCGALVELASLIVDKYLPLLQKKDIREMSKALRKPPEVVQEAIDLIRTLDPRPGQRYNHSDARLIEPDVAFIKRGDEYVVVMNEEDIPTLRLNQGYRRLLSEDGTEKNVKDYVKERYRSALQLMRNIEQRKNTILKTCEAIVRRQREFLEGGVNELKPMMIKEVAEEIGVHPSTVSRAVSSKYVHTPQGVFELRFFFSEAVNGPEGGSTSLMLLKRKVKKIIEDEDPRKPFTDDLIVTMLQSQGIQVTRRTVAKYREDLRIPSTHQRRVRG